MKPYRIALYGPESTGKTTLALQLAEILQGYYVPEYLRFYLETRASKGIFPEQLVSYADARTVFEGQYQLEEQAFAQARPCVILDTCLWQNLAYAQHYFAQWPTEWDEYLTPGRYDLLLLCRPDIPWTADPLRDRPQAAPYMFRHFRRLLYRYELPFRLVEGRGAARTACALRHLHDFFGLRQP